MSIAQGRSVGPNDEVSNPMTKRLADVGSTKSQVGDARWLVVLNSHRLL